MSYQKSKPIYEGKAKSLFEVDGHPELVWMDFKDSLTAFNAQKKGAFEGKGALNRDLASLIFRFLLKKGEIKSHWVKDEGKASMVCEKVSIVPLEVVVRNRLAGSTAKRFGIEEGQSLSRPLVEFYYKDDALGDPFISDEQALVLGFVKEQKTLDQLKKLALKVDEFLIRLFAEVGLELVDFKLEFGMKSDGALLLADEITPDSCRLWDVETGEKMDKDRFRRDLGRVSESYNEVYQRLQKTWGEKL